MTHFFRILNVKESKKINIVHQFQGKPPQKRRIKLKKTMIWTLATMLKCPYSTFFKKLCPTHY